MCRPVGGRSVYLGPCKDISDTPLNTGMELCRIRNISWYLVHLGQLSTGQKIWMGGNVPRIVNLIYYDFVCLRLGLGTNDKTIYVTNETPSKRFRYFSRVDLHVVYCWLDWWWHGESKKQSGAEINREVMRARERSRWQEGGEESSSQQSESSNDC